MQILRHSQIAMTMEIYSEVPTAKTRSALKRLGRKLEARVAGVAAVKFRFLGDKRGSGS